MLMCRIVKKTVDQKRKGLKYTPWKMTNGLELYVKKGAEYYRRKSYIYVYIYKKKDYIVVRLQCPNQAVRPNWQGVEIFTCLPVYLQTDHPH